MAVWLAWAFLLLSLATHAQMPGNLPINASLRIDGGNLESCRVVVIKNGEKVRALTTNLNKFTLELDLDADYVFSFEKPGYVNKKVSFDTHVPTTSQYRLFVPFDFVVTLFRQYDQVNTVAFNQPVGHIHYDDQLGDFDYDTDYSKTVKKQQEEAQAQLERRQKEESRAEARTAKKKESTAPPAPAPAPVVADVPPQPAPASPVVATPAEPKKAEPPAPVAKEPPPPAPAQVVERPKQERATSPKVARIPQPNVVEARVEHSPRPKFQSTAAPATRTTDVVVGTNEVVTVIRVQRGEERDEYRRVARKYSGTYYFKNGRSITRTLYEREALADAYQE